jgi:hypothetical protein
MCCEHDPADLIPDNLPAIPVQTVVMTPEQLQELLDQAVARGREQVRKKKSELKDSPPKSLRRVFFDKCRNRFVEALDFVRPGFAPSNGGSRNLTRSVQATAGEITAWLCEDLKEDVTALADAVCEAQTGKTKSMAEIQEGINAGIRTMIADVEGTRTAEGKRVYRLVCQYHGVYAIGHLADDLIRCNFAKTPNPESLKRKAKES